MIKQLFFFLINLFRHNRHALNVSYFSLFQLIIRWMNPIKFIQIFFNFFIISGFFYFFRIIHLVHIKCFSVFSKWYPFIFSQQFQRTIIHRRIINTFFPNSIPVIIYNNICFFRKISSLSIAASHPL